MILVLASSRDLPARRLVEAWRARDARLVTPADLSRTGWQHHLGESGPELAIASGQRIPVAAIEGVVTRLAAITPDDLPHIVEPDRAYVATEMSAFLVAWLTRLPCPVINRATPSSLMGAPHAPEGWLAIAARAGLRLPATRCSYPAAAGDGPPHDAVTVSVLGDRGFGDVAPALGEQACRLAAAAGVELLAVMFRHAGADAAFAAAHLWPDVSAPELAAALLARFTPSAASRRAAPALEGQA